MKTIPFPVDLLIPKGGRAVTIRMDGPPDGMFSIHVGMEEFDLPHGFEDEYGDDYEGIETEFSLDLYDGLEPFLGSRWDSRSLEERAEGSIYLIHAHHPFDLEELDATEFPPGATEGVIRVRCRVALDFEGLQYDEDTDYAPFKMTVAFRLKSTDNEWELTPA